VDGGLLLIIDIGLSTMVPYVLLSVYVRNTSIRTMSL